LPLNEAPGVFDPLAANPNDPDDLTGKGGGNGSLTANPNDTTVQPILHGNPYGPAVTDGQPNCQAGQTGYSLGEALTPAQSPDTPTFGFQNVPRPAGVPPFGKTDLSLEQNATRVFWDSNHTPPENP